MSEPDEVPTNRPVVEARMNPLAYGLGVQFHPPIKLERKKGLEFAPKLSSAIDIRDVELQEGKWVFSQPLGSNPGGKLRVSVSESELSIEADFPTDSEDLLTPRYGVILNEFRKSFRPALMLGHTSLVRATVQVDGDARTFLSQHVTKFDTNRLQILARPVHLFGIRLFMPAFQVAKEEIATGKGKKAARKIVQSEDWLVDVKSESLIEDPSKLFLEAQAVWQNAKQWNDAATSTAESGVSVASAFLRERFIPFLTHHSQDE